MESRLDPTIADRFRKLSSASISDVTGQRCAMRSYMRPIIPALKIAGPALTVRAQPGDASKPTEAVDMAKRGEVIVIDAKGFEETACWGGNDSNGSKQKGLSAVIVDGAIRDTAEIREMGFPTWAKAVTPRTGGGIGGGEINVPIECGGIVVRPGDIVMADDDGVVVVPAAEATSILEKSIRREAMEKGIMKMVKDGMTLREALEAYHNQGESVESV